MKLREYRRRIEAVMSEKIPREEGKPWHYIKGRMFKGAAELVFRVPVGFSCLDIKRQIDAIYAACGAPVEVDDRAGAVVVRVFAEDFPERIDYKKEFLSFSHGKEILLGFDRQGVPVTHSLRVPHMLIAGQSGYGKTDFTRFILYQLMKHNPPEAVEIWIIDLKGFSFMPFKNVPHVGRIARDLAGAKSLLEEAVRLMEERSREVWDSGNRDKAAAYKTIFVLIDEAYQISPYVERDRERRKLAAACDSAAAKISGTGREAGIGLLYCTQRPDAEVINPLVKANMDCKICFKTVTESNSVIVLDTPGAEKLPHGKPGRILYAANGCQELQVPFIGDDDKWSELLEEVRENEATRGHNEARLDDSIVYDSTGGEVFFDSWKPIQASEREPKKDGGGEVSRGTQEGNRQAESMEAVADWEAIFRDK